MERIHSFSMEGQEDLRIVEHLDMQKLPESIQQMLSLASTPEEQDIILMATLAAASACVPNLYFTDNWQDNGMVLKTEYGHYKKVG